MFPWQNPEFRQKMINRFKGRPRFDMRGDKNPAKKPGVGKKISEVKKGWHPTEEQRKHMSEAHIGKPSPKKGKKLSEESRKRISEAKRGKKRHSLSEETKQKISESHKGEKHWNWKGGITKQEAFFKRGEEYKQWRKLCLERDNFTCQACGHYGGKMVVHHILNFAEYPELRTCITNGITLCEHCHKEFHHKYGTKNNTKEQLVEFKGHKIN